MRIIAGNKRSLPLKTIEGSHTRPTSDRIKETLFNMIAQDLYDCVFADVFAGSGQMGLEAVSRGASKSYFIENNRQAAACIKENIIFTKSQEECHLLTMDAVAAMRMLEHSEVFDIVFMDPPYQSEAQKAVLEYLSDSVLITEHTMIIVEASLETDFSYVKDLGYEVRKEKIYKTNKHVFLYRNS